MALEGVPGIAGVVGEGLARTIPSAGATAAAGLASGQDPKEMLQEIGSHAVSNIGFSSIGGAPGVKLAQEALHGEAASIGKIIAETAKGVGVADATKEANFWLGLGGKGGNVKNALLGDTQALEDLLIETGAFAAVGGAAHAIPLTSRVFDQVVEKSRKRGMSNEGIAKTIEAGFDAEKVGPAEVRDPANPQPEAATPEPAAERPSGVEPEKPVEPKLPEFTDTDYHSLLAEIGKASMPEPIKKLSKRQLGGNRAAETRKINQEAAEQAKRELADQAKELGIDPDELHSVAADMRTAAKESAESINDFEDLKAIRSDMGRSGKTIHLAEDAGAAEQFKTDRSKTGKKASGSIDTAADQFERRTGVESSSESMLNKLKRGKIKEISESESYDRAFKHLLEQKHDQLKRQAEAEGIDVGAVEKGIQDEVAPRPEEISFDFGANERPSGQAGIAPEGAPTESVIRLSKESLTDSEWGEYERLAGLERPNRNQQRRLNELDAKLGVPTTEIPGIGVAAKGEVTQQAQAEGVTKQAISQRRKKSGEVEADLEGGRSTANHSATRPTDGSVKPPKGSATRFTPTRSTLSWPSD